MKDHGQWRVVCQSSGKVSGRGCQRVEGKEKPWWEFRKTPRRSSDHFVNSLHFTFTVRIQHQILTQTMAISALSFSSCILRVRSLLTILLWLCEPASQSILSVHHLMRLLGLTSPLC